MNDEEEYEDDPKPESAGLPEKRKIAKKPHPSRIKPQKPFYYSLKVSKIEEPPLTETTKLELKFKYLLDCFIRMNGRGSHSSSFIFNLKDINASLDDIIA